MHHTSIIVKNAIPQEMHILFDFKGNAYIIKSEYVKTKMSDHESDVHYYICSEPQHQVKH